LSVFIGLALAGVFGVRTSEKAGAEGRFELEVAYASRTRPGLATPWSVTLKTQDGRPIGRPVVIATTSAYFAMFDENGLDPDPDASWTDAQRVYWEFQPASDASTFIVSFDARIEPGVQAGRSGATSLVVDDRDVITVRYRTEVLP
jgi:hypothetical protein